MLPLLTIVLMLMVGYAYLREGIFTAFVMFVNVLLAGIVAFKFFEPLADQLDGMFKDSFLAGFEDALSLVGIFCLTLGALRWATNNLASTEIEFPAIVLRGGSVFFGLLTGYLLAGFLICVMQTLPWPQHFMSFQSRVEAGEGGGGMRRLVPPDHLWLALMHRASQGVLSRGKDDNGHDHAFDPNGSFEVRYEPYRRWGPNGEALPDDGVVTP